MAEIFAKGDFISLKTKKEQRNLIKLSEHQREKGNPEKDRLAGKGPRSN